MPQFNKRGNRIRASDKSLVFRFSSGSLLLLFLAVVMLLNLKTIITTDWKVISLFQDGSVHLTVTPYRIMTIVLAALVCVLATLFYRRFQYDRVKQLFHRQKLARMLLENGWYESESTQDSGFFKDLPATTKKEKITYFPKLYYHMEHGLLYIRTEITLGKYQDQLLHLEKKLETGLYCELVSKELKDSYVEYVLLYDTIANRITINEVQAEHGSLRLMKNVWWEYDKLPHMLIAGGTGGGKTYFILTIIEALLRSNAVMYILDPKNADLADLSVVMPEVWYKKDDITACIDRFYDGMMARSEAMKLMNNASVEYVRGMPVVKAFNQTASSFARLEHAIKEYTEWVLKFSLGWQNYMPAFTTIINNIYLVIVPVGILLGANAQDYKSFTMTFIFYLLFVPAIAGILNKIMYISESFMQIDGNVARMDEIFNIPVLPQTTSPKKTQKDDVVFDNVSFTYTGKKEEMAIENVSFKANQGQITAIVGLSGGGKSTIANLISRFWDVTEGSVKIGGVDIRDISEKDLMNHVSFVFQDIFLFKQSILDNIRMGNPNATEEQVIEAAKAAQCHEFISKLPNGYKTVFGTKGIHLSGGERQRIAIARAIIKDSPIIVLDEATAFSDPENEYLIQKAFEKLMQNKTVIIIAHRLSTIRNADKIIVMEKGHLVEEGKHNELVAAGGRYSQMWNHYTEAVDWKISGKAV